MKVRLVVRMAAAFMLAACHGARPLPAPGASVVQADSLPAGLREGAHEVVVNGVRLWYRVAGTAPADAPPVIFLHGGPGQGSQSFAALAGPYLEPHLRMVYFDQRGSGRSERPWTGKYALETLVEDVEGLRHALGVPRIGIIAQSFGGVLGLEYAARYPRRVSRMIVAAGLSDTPGSIQAQCERLAEVHPGVHARVMDEARRNRSEVCNIFQALPDSLRGDFFQANMYPVASTRERVERADTAGGLRNTGELGGYLFSHGLMEWRFAAHDRLTMPVLVIAGERDYQIGLRPQRELAERLPDAKLLVYEGAGHFMYVDQPERFARDVAAFFNAAPTGAESPSP